MTASLPAADSRDNRRIALAIFAGSLALLWPFYSSHDVYGLDVRFAYFVQEMLRTGPTLYPHNSIGPYPDYPGTSTWILAALARLSGGYSAALAFLPSAICAAATVAVTWRIGALHSRAYGSAAALLLLATLEFLMNARAISLDSYIMFFASLGFYLAAAADQRQVAPPLAWLLLLVGMASMVRGPIGGVLVTGVASSALLANRQWRDFLIFGTGAAVVIAALFLAWLGIAYLEGGSEFVDLTLSFQVGNRFGDPDSALDFYFFSALGSYALSYPLAVIALAAIVASSLAHRRAPPTALLGTIAWLLIVILGMSIPGTKKGRYILAAAPAMALLAGVIFTGFGQYRFPRLRRAVQLALVALPWVILPMLLALLLSLDRGELVRTLALQSNVLAAIALAALWGILALLALRRWSGQRQSLAILAIAAATILCVKYVVEEPGQARHYSSRAFIDQVERFRHEQGPFALGFFAVGPDYDDLNYLVALNSPEHPRYFASLSQLAAASAPPPGILIMPASRAAEFQQQYRGQWREIARGRLGHKHCVAVQLQEDRPAQP